MRDPNEPYTTNSTSRRADIERRGGNNGLMIGGIAGAVLLGALLFWGMSGDGDRVAETNRPASNTAQTTGSATPATPSPNSGTDTNTKPSQNQTTPPARAQ